MTHEALLNNFSLRWLRRAIESELLEIIAGVSRTDNEKQLEYVVKYFLRLRWNCVFDAHEQEVSKEYKNKAYITIAIYLHKYGLYYAPINERAIEALQSLLKDENGLMPKHMYKKAEFAISLLQSKPTHKPKKVSNTVHVYKRELTQFRVGDVFSIQLENKKFAVAVVKHIEGFNEIPVVEAYQEQFDEKPELKLLEGKVLGPEQWMVSNLVNIPDLSNQMKLVGTMEVDYVFQPRSLVKIHQFLEKLTEYTG